jgi:hypothetical protein
MDGIVDGDVCDAGDGDRVKIGMGVRAHQEKKKYAHLRDSENNRRLPM